MRTHVLKKWALSAVAVLMLSAPSLAQQIEQLEPQPMESQPIEEAAEDTAQAIAAQEPAEPEPDYYVLQTDPATGASRHVKLEGKALPGQAVFIIRETEPGSGEYTWFQLEEQPASVRQVVEAEPETQEEPEAAPQEPDTLVAVAPPVIPEVAPPPAEHIPWYKAGKHTITIPPFFLITNVALGFGLGLDGIKDALNEQLAMEYKDFHVVSEMLMNANGKMEITGLKSSGFGFALQYEYRLLKNYALMGRFSHSALSMSMDLEDTYTDIDLISDECVRNSNGACVEITEEYFVDFKFHNWSFELHNRYYPRADGSLFFDGVIGFGGAGLSTKKTHVVDEGEYVFQNPNGTFSVGNKKRSSDVLDVPAKRGYMVIGPMFGWREVFGKGNGGFTWETSFGYLAGIGFSTSLAEYVIDENVTLPHEAGEYSKDIDGALKGTLGLIESLAIVGGPRFRMTFGWCF